MDKKYQKIYNQINNELDKREMSTNKLSLELDYDVKAVYHAFNNPNSGPSKKMLERIADYFGMACVYCRGEYSLAKIEPSTLDEIIGAANG